jgi:ribosomal protein L37E
MATQGQLGKLIKKGGEFTPDSVAMCMEGMAGDLVRDWKKFAEGRPTIGFFPRRTQAQEAKELLQEAGLRVAYVDGETPDDSRQRIFWELGNGKLDYLCNVQVLERGTDIPAVSCIQLCTAIGSIVRYRQIVGRGSRIHPSKTETLVIDHGGSIKRHGFFEDDYSWSLDITTKDAGEQGQRPTIACPRCSSVYRGGKCSSCGYEPTPKERKGQGLEFDGRELKEIKPSEKNKKDKVPTSHEIMSSCLFRMGKSGNTWRQCFALFKRECEKHGVNYRIPRTLEIAGRTYRMLRHDDTGDHGRKVAVLFPIVLGKHGGDYLEKHSETIGEPY